MQTEYTSLNDLPGRGPNEVVTVYSTTEYNDFYRNRAGSFAYRGIDETNERRPRFKPEEFVNCPDIKGVHTTPFNTVVIQWEGERYHLPYFMRGQEAFCHEIWQEGKDGAYYQVHVLRLPQDHPANWLFQEEEVVYRKQIDLEAYGGAAA